MGFSTVVAEAILLIAVIVCASMFATSIIAKMIEVRQSVEVKSRDVITVTETKVVIVYTMYNDTTGYFKVYLKNAGRMPVYDIERFTVIFGEYGKGKLYEYSASGGLGTWNYTEYNNPNNILDIHEIICINIFNDTIIDNPCYVKITLPQGLSVEEVFSYET